MLHRDGRAPRPADPGPFPIGQCIRPGCFCPLDARSSGAADPERKRPEARASAAARTSPPWTSSGWTRRCREDERRYAASSSAGAPGGGVCGRARDGAEGTPPLCRQPGRRRDPVCVLTSSPLTLSGRRHATHPRRCAPTGGVTRVEAGAPPRSRARARIQSRRFPKSASWAPHPFRDSSAGSARSSLATALHHRKEGRARAAAAAARVQGMPRAAADTGSVDTMVPLSGMAETVMAWVGDLLAHRLRVGHAS